MALHMFCHGYFRPVLTIAKSDCKLRRVWPHRTVRLTVDGFSWTWLKIFRNVYRKSNFHLNIPELPVHYVKTNLVQW